MPLPNLRGGSSYNTSSSNVQAENYSGGASYREQVREKMLNTPRQTNVDYKKSIDLTITRDNFRSSSRLKLQNKNPDSDDSFDAQTKRSNNNKPQSARNRQIVFYNKTYVPGNEDTSSQISIQDDEPNPNQSNISPNNSMNNLFTNNTNSEVNIQANKNRQPKPRKESIFIDDSRRSFKSRRSDYDEKDNDVNSNHKKENRVKNRYETSRPNSRDSFYQSDDENAHTNHDDNDDVMVRRPKSTYSTRRRNRNDESNIDLNNNNKNVNTNFSIGEQEANGRKSRIEINSNGFNENESNGQQNVRMTPRRARTFNTNRYSLNIDHFKANDEFDVVESKSTNDFNLRSASRVGFREDNKADSNENNTSNNRNPPVPAPRKRNDNNAFTNKLNLNEINDFRIKRTSTANSSKLLTPKISYIPSSPRSTSHQSEESLNRSFNNKASSSSNSANLENRRVEITQEYIRYQRQQSPIIKSNENLQSRNGRLANNNNSFSYDSKTDRQHSTRPNSINRNWQ